MTDADLIVFRRGEAGVIALNRPASRNALTGGMVQAFRRALNDFGGDDALTSVIVKSSGEGAFCAGGDIRAIHQARVEGRHEDADAFFGNEFALNAFIAGFPKTFVALINGICFGGGMGITVHGQHRIVGEAALLAMPEVAIGYVPDVGASFFLNRLPRPMARFLGLTGYRLSAADALYTGLATAFVPGAGHADVEARLARGEPVVDVLAQVAEQPGESRLARHVDVVERCFSHRSVERIKDALSRERGVFACEALNCLERASPSSLHLTIELLDRTRGMSLTGCLAVELDLAKRVTRGPDFAEGVRALLVDKDRNPHWGAAQRISS